MSTDPHTPGARSAAITFALDTVKTGPASRLGQTLIRVIEAMHKAGWISEGPLRGSASGTPAGYAVVSHYDGRPDPDFVYDTVTDASSYVTDMCAHPEDWRVYELREVPALSGGDEEVDGG